MGNAVGHLRGYAARDAAAAVLRRNPPVFRKPPDKLSPDRPSRHAHGTVDDLHIRGSGRQQHVLIALGGITLLGGNEAGCHLHAVGTQRHDLFDILLIPDAAGTENRNVSAAFLFIGLQGAPHLRQNLCKALTVALQELLFLEAEVSAGFCSLNDHKVRLPLILLLPYPGNEGRRPTAGNDGRNQCRALGYVFRQRQRKPRAGDHRVNAAIHCRPYRIRVLPCGHHGIYRQKAVSLGQCPGIPNLLPQRPEIGCLRGPVKVRLPVAAVCGADAAHGTGQCHRPGETLQRHTDSHAALDQGVRQRPTVNFQYCFLFHAQGPPISSKFLCFLCLPSYSLIFSLSSSFKNYV